MRYDDRLATVLRLSPGGGTVTRIQLRQLIDLLGTAPADARGEMMDAAYTKLAELSARIPPAERADLLAQPGLRLRSPRLVAALAGYEPAVAQAAIHAARLSDNEWLDLMPALPPRALAMLNTRRDLGELARAALARLGVGDRGLPARARAADAASDPSLGNASPAAPATATMWGAETIAPPAPSAGQARDMAQSPPPPAPLPPATVPHDEATAVIGAAMATAPIAAAGAPEGIAAIVRRIEAFRAARAAGTAAAVPLGGDSPRLPLGEEHPAPMRRADSFDFASDGAGRIMWSDAAVAPMVVGFSLASAPALRDMMGHQQPIRGGRVDLAGAPAVAGAWWIDAAPRFDTPAGRFAGYLGRLRRPANDTAAAPADAAQDGDQLRQLLHELRTPVNAIQGFAEIIQQQLFGPTPHEYRAHAAAIASDAARILAGFDELERYARIDSGAEAMGAGFGDLGTAARATIARLEPHGSARGSGFDLEALAGPMPVALAEAEVEALCWRLLAPVAALSAPGESLAVRLTQAGELLCLEIAKPVAMMDSATQATPAANAPTAGMFGHEFTLRLAGAEARSAGGRLARGGGHLRLYLPAAADGGALQHG